MAEQHATVTPNLEVEENEQLTFKKEEGKGLLSQ